MTAPAVSVLMAVRDGAYLAPALDTLLAQSLGDIEVVVVDDGADAAARAVLADRAAADARVVPLRREAVSGSLPAALNLGLARCRAPLVARADADDAYHPERLARQAAVFAARPGLVALSCGYRRIDVAGRVLLTHRPVTGPARIRFRAMFSNSLLHPGAMIRRDALNAVGGYDERFWTAQDSDLWARLAPLGELDNLPGPLVDWRLHGASVLATRGDAGRALSLSVSARLQTAYLGADPGPVAVASAVDLWRSYAPLDRATVAEGERALGRILVRAREVETPDIARDLETCTASALWRQARWRLRTEPAAALRLAARSLRWRAGRAEPAAPAAPRRVRAA